MTRAVHIEFAARLARAEDNAVRSRTATGSRG